MPPQRSRWFARAAAAIAFTLLFAGGVTIAAPQRAEAAPASGLESLGQGVGADSTWRELLDAAIGDAGSALGLTFGSFNLASMVGGPLISALFGPASTGPSIVDVMKELDDIEKRLDQVQSSLTSIEANVVNVNVNVLMASCNDQTAQLTQYVNQLEFAQEDYRNIVDEMAAIEDGTVTDGGRLKVLIDRFILFTTGEASPTAVNDSKFAQLIGGIHAAMVQTGGNQGIITGCGDAFFAQWQASQNAGARGAVAADAQGAWLDDRQYYASIERMSRYWQSVQLQAMFLLQQAAVLQSSKLYVAQGGVLEADAPQTVCAIASAAPNMAQAKEVCSSAFAVSKRVFSNLSSEWHQIGRPLSTDDVVMSLGSDATGLPGGPAVSALWARTPSAVGVDWTSATWSTASTPVSYGGYAGFGPAGSQQWKELEAGYRFSHPGVPVPSGGFFDLLGAMGTTKASGSDTPVFGTAGVQTVWMPNETTTSDERAFLNRHTPGLGFPSQDDFGREYFYDDSGFSVRCMVLPVDGRICDQESVSRWWNGRQTGEWNLSGKSVFTIRPGSPAITPLVVELSDEPTYCVDSRPEYYGCGYATSAILSPPAPASGEVPGWMVGWSGEGGSYDNPNQIGTLWPTAALPTCATGGNRSAWGAVTQCSDAIDTWIRATIPNPSILGPQPVSAPVVADSGELSGVLCTVPAWQERSGEAGVAVRTTDATWLMQAAGYKDHSEVIPIDRIVSLDDLIEGSGWRGSPATYSLRCAYTARYADLASTTDLQTAPVIATRSSDGGYRLGGYTLGNPTAEPGTPIGGQSPTGAVPASAADETPTLAATGTDPMGAFWFGAAAAVFGALILLRSRRRASR